MIEAQMGTEKTMLNEFRWDERYRREAIAPVQNKIGQLFASPLLRNVLEEHRVTAVIHFAAYAYVGESVGNPRKYYRNNVAGTLNLLDAMLDAGVRDIVFSSTCAVYGEPVRVPID